MSSSMRIQPEVVFLGEIADSRQDGDRVGDGIEAEDAHRAALRPEQTQNVPDERRLPRAVCADEAIDRPAREGEAHRVQGRRGTEATRQLRDADDRFTHTLIYGSTGNEGPSPCITASERGILSVACVAPGTLPNADRAEREQMRKLKIMEHISLD